MPIEVPDKFPDPVELALVKCLHEVVVRTIGFGYHPDTPGGDYVQLNESLGLHPHYDTLIDYIRAVYEQYNVDIYADALRIWQIMKNEIG